MSLDQEIADHAITARPLGIVCNWDLIDRIYVCDDDMEEGEWWDGD